MNDSKSKVRNISDTARWVAYFRAIETQRPDALFSDSFAERLAGERGFQIANSLPEGNKHDWAWVARTYLFDEFILRAIQEGADVVMNLGAGLDARPYRLTLPPKLRWIDVDLPEILAYKSEVLVDEKPKCQLESIYLDLSNQAERRVLFQEVNRTAKKVAVLTEGLLIYFTAEEVGSLSADLAEGQTFRNWIVDLASPGQLKRMQLTSGRQLSEVGAAFKFGPKDGPGFFAQYGWEAADVQGMLKTAARFKRAPAELLALLPEPAGLPGNYPWTGVCLLKRADPE
jgi:methyltransferase (TIGR00027 family)